MIFFYLLFLRVAFAGDALFWAGAALGVGGMALCAALVAAFAAPDRDGFCQSGVHRFSRNPMYAGYFLCFMGWALPARSLALGGMVLAFRFCAHGIIWAEERWCETQFGEAYRQYETRVRRYWGRHAPH